MRHQELVEVKVKRLDLVPIDEKIAGLLYEWLRQQRYRNCLLLVEDTFKVCQKKLAHSLVARRLNQGKYQRLVKNGSSLVFRCSKCLQKAEHLASCG